jgi:hypothetical protein
MARVKVLFDKSGDKFKVGDVCDPNNPTGCVGSFKNLLGKVADFNEADVELTDRYFQQEELPPKLETVGEPDED